MRFVVHVMLYLVYSLTCLVTVLWRSVLIHLLLWLIGLGVFLPLLGLAAVFPILRGLCAFVAPFSPGPFFRWKHGLRKPSGREQVAIDAVAERLESSVQCPLQVLVLDGPGTRIQTVGATTIVERGLFDHWLPGALAHEIGQLNSGTPATHLALWWSRPQLMLSASEALRRSSPEHEDEDAHPGITRRLLAFLLQRFDGTNRFGDLIVRYMWPPIIKRDVYASDRWAAGHGFVDELEAFIEATRLPMDFASPWPWLSPEPGGEKRLSKLHASTGVTYRPRFGARWTMK